MNAVHWFYSLPSSPPAGVSDDRSALERRQEELEAMREEAEFEERSGTNMTRAELDDYANDYRGETA